MQKSHIEKYLSHLASNLNVSKTTQDQAFSAILFLYQKVLNLNTVQEIKPVRSTKQKTPPVVMTQEEVQIIIGYISGEYQLMCKLLYGCGLRLMECLRLRVQDEKGNLPWPEESGTLKLLALKVR